MNLKEFLNYKTHCPLCDSALIIYFNNLEVVEVVEGVSGGNNYFYIDFVLKAKKRGQRNYEVRLLIDENDNYQYDFKQKDKENMKVVPIFLLNRFKDYLDDLIYVKFSVRCDDCKFYYYNSNFINLNLKMPFFTDLSFENECIDEIIIDDNSYYITNYFSLKEMLISVKSGTNYNYIKFPLIDLKSKADIDAVVLRAKKLLPFL